MSFLLYLKKLFPVIWTGWALLALLWPISCNPSLPMRMHPGWPKCEYFGLNFILPKVVGYNPFTHADPGIFKTLTIHYSVCLEHSVLKILNQFSFFFSLNQFYLVCEVIPCLSTIQSISISSKLPIAPFQCYRIECSTTTVWWFPLYQFLNALKAETRSSGNDIPWYRTGQILRNSNFWIEPWIRMILAVLWTRLWQEQSKKYLKVQFYVFFSEFLSKFQWVNTVQNVSGLEFSNLSFTYNTWCS